MSMEECKGNRTRARVLLPMAPSGADEATSMLPPRLYQSCVSGYREGPSGKIPQVASNLKWEDHWGTIKARFGVGRMHYTVDPGLYALGQPDEHSPILVTANYKMSFDALRGSLPGRNAWILVLDTKGINVWCAAGKGTFGTEELLRRITASGLKDLVNHRDLILPQLGAPGVAAHIVKKLTGFKVHYGPISAQDVPDYLDAGMKATPAMRRKDFPLNERVVLIPIELIESLKAAFIIIPVMLVITGFSGREGFLQNIIGDGVFTVYAVMGAVIAGTVLNPILLPYLPGRAFTTKGLAIGFATAFVLLWSRGITPHSMHALLLGSSWLLMIPAVAAYLAMNFTGASTYTSLSGVKKEMRWALPLEITAGLSGFAVWIVSRIIQ
ncbi:MAG TPA: mercury methylation corrinoid protein HgcA [Desulfomonilia bacterium]|nr:mercury methylation corrinoid protein HgcA [Desulfomonilia bacterium]